MKHHFFCAVAYFFSGIFLAAAEDMQVLKEAFKNRYHRLAVVRPGMNSPWSRVNQGQPREAGFLKLVPQVLGKPSPRIKEFQSQGINF